MIGTPPKGRQRALGAAGRSDGAARDVVLSRAPVVEVMVKAWQRWLLVLVGGVVLPVSFAGFDQWYLTWVAFVPLFLAIEGQGRRKAARLGFIYGLVANGVGYYWIPYTIHVFGGFPEPLAWGFDLVLCAYQAGQYSLLAYLIVRLRERGHDLLWVAPAAMVGLETVYPLLFPIFMANTQHPVPLLMQTADLLGPLLGTAIIILFNAAITVAVQAAAKKERIPWKRVVLGPLALALMVGYGAVRIPMVEAAMAEGTELSVGIVQANMGIFEKWRDVREGVRRHRDGTRELVDRGAELVVWSEAGFVDGIIRPAEEPNVGERVLGRVRVRVPVLFGALTRRPGDDSPERRRRRTYNSAVMMDASGAITGVYDKTYLLAFGEYLPFGDVFPELYDYSPHSGSMSPGSELTALPLEHEGRTWLLGALICYEDILPRFTRDLVRAAHPNLLVNMTNDAWFGDTNEPWIHFALAKFRAVEHRRYLVRATNTGVSAIVDPVGRVVLHGRVFQEERLLGDVRLLEGGGTLYEAVGDVLGWAALLLLAVGLFRTRKVWLRAPAEPGRAGVVEAGRVLLAVGIADGLALALLLVLRPAGWSPPGLPLFLWLGGTVAFVAAFVLLRRRRARGLQFAWAGCGLRALLTLTLAMGASPERRPTALLLLGVPLGFALLAGANLYSWRGRAEAEPEPRPKKKRGAKE